MTHYTTKWGLPVIDGTDIINTMDDTDEIKFSMLDDLLTPYDRGALSGRPVSTPGSPGIRGRRYYATDLGIEFADSGTGWEPSGIPLGAALDWFGASDPCDQLMICDGRAISRSTYSGLFSILGTTFGSGDGSTTFNIPDTRDRTLVGVSGTIARGATGGAKTHTLATTEIPAHQHQQTGNEAGTGTANGLVRATTSAVSFVANRATDAAGGGLPHNNMQPYLGAHKLIRVL